MMKMNLMHMKLLKILSSVLLDELTDKVIQNIFLMVLNLHLKKFVIFYNQKALILIIIGY